MAITKPKQTGKGPPAMPGKPRGPATTKMPPPPVAEKAAPKKKFTVETWDDKRGEQILIYGDTGVGKTSLARLAPRAVFIGCDDGGNKILNPDGSHLKRIPGVDTFADVRSALQQHDLYSDFDTAVIDTATILEDWAEVHVVETITTEKGAKVKNIMGYGYNKGYKHLYNVMKLILQDCDALVRSGKNVIIICQGINNNIPNPGGEDFLRHGPRLHVDKTWSIEALYCEWADHILRIAYYDTQVGKDRKIQGTTTRAVFTQPEPHFRAKSRTVHEPVVSFQDDKDDSVWEYVFGEDK